MVRMALLAEGDEVGRPVASSINAPDNVVYVKRSMGAAVPASESVACLDVGLYVVIAHRFAFLVALAFDVFVLDTLDIE